MRETLVFINQKMQEAGIPYELGEWRSKVRYPYFVGTYTETEHTFEDGHSAGMMQIDGWSNTSLADLVQCNEQIRQALDDQAGQIGQALVYTSYAGADVIPTNVEGLYRIRVTINTQEWKEQ